MSFTVFTQLPYDVPPTLGTIDPNDVISYEELIQMMQAPEVGVYDHWFFNNSLIGSANGKALTPQSANHAQYASYVSLTTEMGNALLTDLTHGAAYTVCMVAKLKKGYTGTTITQLAGVVDGSTAGASMIGFDHTNGLGVGPYITGGGFGTAPRLQNNLDDWQFISSSFSGDLQAAVNSLTGDSKNGIQKVQKTSTNALASNRLIGLGNGYFNQANGTTVKMQFDCAEFIVFTGTKTLVELEDIYKRSQLRMQFKNISI